MRAIKAFNKGKCSRCCTIFCCRRKKIEHKYFKNTWPRVERAYEPSIIKWENLHIGKCGRCIRILFVSLVSLILMAVSFTVIILAKDYETQMRKEFKALDCQSTTITTEEAEIDHSLPVDDQQGLLHCFCLTELNNRGLGVRDIVFPSGEKLCDDWFTNYTITNALIYASVLAVVMINTVLKAVLRFISTWERAHTHTEEKLSSTLKMFVA